MIFAKSTYRADGAHSLISTYPLCFDTLAHTCHRQKSQPLSFQPLPHTCPQNTRGGYGSKTRTQPSGFMRKIHSTPPANPFIICTEHPGKDANPERAARVEGSPPANPFIICSYEKRVGGVGGSSLLRYLIASLLRHFILHLQTLRTLQFGNHPADSVRIET